MRNKIYSDGKNRNIDLGFEIPFNNNVKITSADGVSIPFIMSGRNRVRFTGGIPTGDIFVDYEEPAPSVNPLRLDALTFSLIQPKDLERLNRLSQEIGIKENIINQKELDIIALADTIEALETKNAQTIDENMLQVQKSLEKLYADVIDVRNESNGADVSLSNSIRQVAQDFEIVLEKHEQDTSNPHKVTKKQVGLDKVDNTADLDKPVSKAVQKELDKKLDKTEAEKIRDEIKKSEKKVDKIYTGMSNMTGGIAQLEVPRGGTTNQVLAKASNKDGDFKWANSATGDINHNDTLNRDASDAHPISAITNLQSTLNTKITSADVKNAPITIDGVEDTLTNHLNTIKNDLGDLGDDVSEIQAKIPSQATSSNQLADKDFVNSSIATNTAHYISNNGEPFTSLEQLQAYTGTVTNNDYAFVTGTDSAGNTYYDRYKATVSGSTITWAKEYRLNNSSFTAAQWAAITSGITSGDVALIQTAIQPDDLGTLAYADYITNGDISGTINQDKITNLISDLASKVSDVQLNGTSVVTSGVANIPYASSSNAGVFKINTASPEFSVTSSGILHIEAASDTQIYNKNTNYNPIAPYRLDYAIKCGLGNGSTQTAWTSSEQANARTVLGTTQVSFVKWSD